MASSGGGGGVSEIVEAKEEEDLDLIHPCFKGGSKSNTLTVKAKAKVEAEAEAEADDGVNQLISAFHLRTSSKVASPSRQMVTDLLQKNASKKPIIKVGIPQASGIGISESVTLKQALRKLCVSQASEMAATKRLSKPIGLSDVPEAGAIKRLLASLVVPTSESDDKGKLVEISLVPEKTTKGPSKNTVLHKLSKLQSPNQISVSSPCQAVSPTAKVQKTRIQDVIADNQSDPVEIGVKGKADSKGIRSSKPSTSRRLMKPVLGNKTSVEKKGKQQTESTLGNSNKCSEVNTVTLAPSKNKSASPKESISPACSSTNAPDSTSMMKNKDSGVSKPKPDVRPHRSCVVALVGAKINGDTRTIEKGESSQSSKSSMGGYSSSTSLSDESHQSSSGNGSRPHMSKDVRWESIRDVVLQHGNLGLNNFRLLKRLGCGDIGTIYLAELTGSDCMFALKVMDVEFLLSRKKMLRAQTEREILQMLDHPFLPTLYANFTTDNLSCLVMEYCPGGDLHVLRQRQPGRNFPEAAARFYVAEVLLALEYLHMLGVIYRDLKPENILVREDGHVMLSDFDLSLRCTVRPTLLRSSSLGCQEAVKRPSGPCSENSCIEPLCLQPSWVQVSCFTPRLASSTTAVKTRKQKSDQAGQVSSLQLVVEPTDARSNSFVGTHEYLAPEIIRGDGHGSAVDWWTFGIFLYELLFGRTPFKGPGNVETLANVISQSLRFPESPAVSFHAKDLIRALLVKEPENRLGSTRGAAEIKQHPFFEGMNWALIRCAAPPEIPKSCDVGTAVGAWKKKEDKCLDFRSNGDDIEFELF